MTKFPQVFPRDVAVKTERKSLNIAISKRPRKQGGGGNIQAIRVRKNTHGTLGDIKATQFSFYTLYSFPGQPQGYPNPMPFFYQPGFQMVNSENTFVQNTNLCITVLFGGRKVGSEISSTITSTTKSSVSSLNAGEL